MRAKKHIVEDMVFVNHLPEPGEEDLYYRLLKQSQRRGGFGSVRASPMPSRCVCHDPTAFAESPRRPRENRSASSASLPRRSWTPTSLTLRFHRHDCVKLVLRQRPLQSIRDLNCSKFVLFFLLLALIIQTLEPRVEALEANASLTPSASPDSAPTMTRMTVASAPFEDASSTPDRPELSTDARDDIFNWSSGFFDVSFSTPSAVTPAVPSSWRACRVGGPPCHFGKCVDGDCVCDAGWDGAGCQICRGRGRLEGETGVIHDGHGNYTDYTTCTWLVKGPERTRIRFNFAHFATECSWDHLYVHDGPGAFSPLLGIFSGLINVSPHPLNPELDYSPEILTSSNVAYLHFYSDAAYNMTGFSINYTADYCDNGSCCPRNCSGAGVCSNSGTCSCDDGYLGEACRVPACAKGGKSPSVPTLPQSLKNPIYTYEDWQCALGPNGLWNLLKPRGDPRKLPALASHKSVVNGDFVYLVGGISFSVDPSPKFITTLYLGSGDVWDVPDLVSSGGSLSSNEPLPRYGHSANLYKSGIFVFGGVVNGSVITNEMWEYNLKTFSWSLVVGNSSASGATSLAPPLAVSGHSSVVVGDKLVVIFGHSPIYGYVNHVQEYYFDNKTWSIPKVFGAVVKGGYGHSAIYVASKQLIFVHGGLVSEKQTASHLVDSLFEYDPFRRYWRILRASGQPKNLHSMVEMNGLLLTFGGNTHKDTAMSFGAKCFSSDFMAYDTECGRWHRLPAPETTLMHDVSRFGHSAFVHRGKMFVYGGFNGFMLADSMVYSPATCSHIATREDCLAIREGVKCVWASNKPGLHCRTEEEAKSLSDNKQILPNLIERASCDLKTSTSQFDDADNPVVISAGARQRVNKAVLHSSRDCIFPDCASCIANTFNCTWCLDTCHSASHPCPANGESDDAANATRGLSEVNSPAVTPLVCDGEQREATAHYCSNFHNCLACAAETHCMWQHATGTAKCVPVKNHQVQSFDGKDKDMKLNHYNPCDPPCSSKTSCHNCTYGMCMWCDNVQRCVDSNAYVVSFPYGQCMAWANNKDICPVKRCSDIKTCDACLKDPRCGWCDDGSRTGLGTCLEGGDDGPVNVHPTATRGIIPGVHLDVRSIVGNNSTEFCHKNRWHFTACPGCQCHGHAVCPPNSNECGECGGNAEGDHCQSCKDGFWGKPKLGNNCTACECNHQAVTCDRNDGSCFCKTKGIIGDKCQSCDVAAQYFGNPLNGSCFYQLKPDYHYTFNLSRPEDIYYTQINFQNMPQKPRKDVEFTLNCSQECKFNITFRSLKSNGERLIFSGTCSQKIFEKKFKASQHHFGDPFNTTFFVYVYDFQGGNKARSWFHVKISFQSNMQFSLVNLFIIFFSCFLSLLLVGAVVWKIKQRYDNYRRRQRAYVEMEQMASRPFAMVCPDLSYAPPNDPIPSNPVPSANKHTSRPKPLYCPSPIALEPCADSKAAVLSLLVILPQGDEDMTPPGTTGLLIGSTLVNLGANRKASEGSKLHREGWSSRKGGPHTALKDAANSACRNTHNPPPLQHHPQPPPPPNDDVVWGI